MDGRRQWINEAKAFKAIDSGKADGEHIPSSQILLVKKEDIGEDMNVEVPTLETLSPPPSTLSRKVQTQHSVAYKELHKRIVDAGLYECPYITGYGPEVIRYTLLAALSIWTYQHSWYIPSAFFLGLFWHQLTFTVHDLGHMGVTHNWTVDRLIATCIAQTTRFRSRPNALQSYTHTNSWDNSSCKRLSRPLIHHQITFAFH